MAGEACVAVPEPLEAVELSDPTQHDVHDDVVQIDEHPLAVTQPLDAKRAKPGFLRLLADAVGDGAHVSVGISGSNDHRIRDVRESSYVEHSYVDGLHVFECCGHDALERGHALGGAARAFTSGHAQAGASFECVLVDPSIAPRLEDDRPHGIGHEIAWIASRDDELAQLRR
jgi:hypothetical protein